MTTEQIHDSRLAFEAVENLGGYEGIYKRVELRDCIALIRPTFNVEGV